MLQLLPCFKTKDILLIQNKNLLSLETVFFIFFVLLSSKREILCYKIANKSFNTLSFTENSGKTLQNFEFLGKFSLSFRKNLEF